MIHLVNVSGGIASAAALFRVIERYGAENTRAVFADTNDESEDTYRFLSDIERVSGITIVRLNQGKNCWDIWLERMMLTDPKSGGCLASYHLKKEPLHRHAEEVGTPDNVTIYVGFGPDEDDRIVRLRKSAAPWMFDFPLCWSPRMSRCDAEDDIRRRGITPPPAYSEGYPHNNCNRRCVLAGVRQWSWLHKDDPAAYKEYEDREQEFLQRLAAAGRTPHTILRDRRDGTTRNLSLKQLREEIESGERDHADEFRSCSCMGGLWE